MTDPTYTPPPSSNGLGISLPSVSSASLWSSLAGVAAILCSTLKVDPSLSGALQNLLLAVGGVLIAIPAHHVIGKQQGTLPTAAPSPAPPHG